MKNFCQPGQVVTMTAPADLASGDALVIGNLFGVATGPALTGEEFEMWVARGVFEMPYDAGGVVAEGTALFHDGATPATMGLAGVAVVGVAVRGGAPLGTETTIFVRIDGVSI